jgi:hypothetical protein
MHTYMHACMHRYTQIGSNRCIHRRTCIRKMQTTRQTERQTVRQANKQTYLHSHARMHPYIHASMHTYKHAHRQTDTQTNRQINIHIHPYILAYIQRCIHTHTLRCTMYIQPCSCGPTVIHAYLHMYAITYMHASMSALLFALENVFSRAHIGEPIIIHCVPAQTDGGCNCCPGL